MIKSHSFLIAFFLGIFALTSCGGGSEPVVDQADDAAVSATNTAADAATDTATDVASDANDAVTSTEGAVSDAMDPAAWEDLEANWESQISSAQAAFPDLTADEISGTAGKPENMVSLVEQKYEISREEAQTRVSEWANSL